MTVGVMTVGVMSVGVMRRPHLFRRKNLLKNKHRGLAISFFYKYNHFVANFISTSSLITI